MLIIFYLFSLSQGILGKIRGNRTWAIWILNHYKTHKKLLMSLIQAKKEHERHTKSQGQMMKPEKMIHQYD